MNFQYLIYIHAAFGGIALLAGTFAIIAKKGSSAHKKSGKVFYYIMLASALTALVISAIPSNFNPFLFSIGVFSAYLIISGYRALRYKRKVVSLVIDKTLTGVMMITGLGMILMPVILEGKPNIVLAVFGIISLILTLGELRAYKNLEKLRKGWLAKHLGNMIGGYIAAVTAFIVVNQILPGVYGWLTPTAVGLGYMFYWTKKIK